MENLQIKGTNVSLINSWIKVMQGDIKKNKFYLANKRDEFLYPTPANKARLHIMQGIFGIRLVDHYNNPSDGMVSSKARIKSDLKKMGIYLRTLKLLLKIN